LARRQRRVLLCDLQVLKSLKLHQTSESIKTNQQRSFHSLFCSLSNHLAFPGQLSSIDCHLLHHNFLFYLLVHLTTAKQSSLSKKAHTNTSGPLSIILSF
jgi:hypothetical protein